MKLAIFSLFLAVFTAVATASNEIAPKICGTEITPEEIAAAEVHFKEHKVPPSDKAVPVTIPVYFHVIRADNTVQGGNVPDLQINNQIRVLNSAFAPAMISFRLTNITRTTNMDWFNNASPKTGQQVAMKNLLRTGNAGTLNVYTVGFTRLAPEYFGLIGYATYPQFYATAPRDDGAVIQFSTISGGSTPEYNMGKNLVHEVGHWAGLLHTFEGACAGTGDEVADTPPERSAAAGCPTSPPRDTCPGGGVDPIHNYMDYSNDACRTQFTPGQIARMRQRMNTYRNIPI